MGPDATHWGDFTLAPGKRYRVYVASPDGSGADCGVWVYTQGKEIELTRRDGAVESDLCAMLWTRTRN